MLQSWTFSIILVYGNQTLLVGYNKHMFDGMVETLNVVHSKYVVNKWFIINKC